MTEKVRLGILGTGNMAHNFASGLRHADNVELVAVASRDRQSAQRFSDEFELASHYSSYQSLADCADIQLVYIATPHSCHLENSLMCLEAGKAVLCEKPFAINAIEAGIMIAKAREKQLFLMEAMWTRYIPAIVKLRELLAENIIGNVQLMIAGGAFMPAYDPDAYLFRPDLGGGVLLDAGVYLVSLASMLFGAPVSIQAAGELGKSGVDEHDAVLLHHGAGALASLFVSLRASASPEFTLFGAAGRIRVHAPLFAPSRLTISVTGAEEQTVDLPFSGNGYQFQAMEAARCILAGQNESNVMPLDESLAIMQTMDEIRHQIGMKYPMED